MRTMAALVLAASSLQAARSDRTEPPRAFKVRLSDASLDLQYERRLTYRKSKTSDSFFDEDATYLLPSLNLTLSGSVYHPELLTYRLYTQIGTERVKRVQDQPSGAVNRDEDERLQQYDLNLHFFRSKAYATGFRAARYTRRRDVDFFARVTVRGEGYGMRTGYNAGILPVSLSYDHWEEVTGGSRPSVHVEQILRFNALNYRRARENKSDLSLTWNNFRRREQADRSEEGGNLTLEFNDLSYFGTGREKSFRTQIDATRRIRNTRDTLTLTALENLRIQHAEHVAGDYSYTGRMTASDDNRNAGHRLQADMRHSLYSSLVSTLRVDGDVARSQTEDSSSQRLRYGGGAFVDYRKQLGDDGSLFVGLVYRLHKEQRESAAGTISIVDERHVLRNDAVVTLNLPNVMTETIVVTDDRGVVRYRPGLDYRIVPLGLYTGIDRIVGGTIPPGATILVSYDATGRPTDDALVSRRTVNFRLQLLGRRLELYGRINPTASRGGETFQIEDGRDIVGGVRSFWRSLRGGAEYRSNNSLARPYQSLRMFAGYTVYMGPASALGFDLSQVHARYTNPSNEDRIRSVTAHYRTRPRRWLTLGAAAGVRKERGDTRIRDLLTGNIYSEINVGKMSWVFGYEYENDQLADQDRELQFLYLRGRRFL